ncbi:uncharacterized protein LOC142588548 [Dermacentor variabilis]|uniref:uncharacterized protein LOC142588548 n=1 Tax=Dermacentor variabilis TaxID=34621 RepID=UPI003F5BC0F7
MLRNLAANEEQRLLECFNVIWQSGQVPEAWRTTIVATISKARKPTGELASYRPVFLTSATCKVMEAMVLGAFDSLPHAVVQQGLDLLGSCGNLREFISSSFLHNRPRPVTEGAPQGSVVSPFLLDLALARLPDALPIDPHFPVQSSIYADDIALWVRGPPHHIRKHRPYHLSQEDRGLAATSQSSRPPLGCPAALEGRPHPTEQGSHLPGAAH